MKLYIILLVTLIISCKNHPKTQISNATLPSVDTIVKTEPALYQEDTIELQEFFVDSINIGKRTKNKIEISKFSLSDYNYVVIKFYSKLNNRGWLLKQQFNFEKDGSIGCLPKLSDFNGDKLNDFTYVSAAAGRGANQIRRLFIYSENRDNLTFIKNSDSYPNLLYNNELKCIDAFLVYGGCTTVFLKIKGDSLEEFASVELSDGLTVTEYKKGERKVISQDSTNKAGFIRYKNYRPLTEANEY